MSTPRSLQGGRVPGMGALAAAWALGAAVTAAHAEPKLRYDQGAQGMVMVRTDLASAPAAARSPIDSVMVNGKMTQVLRAPSAAPAAKLAAQVQAPGQFTESVLPNGSRMLTRAASTSPQPAAATQKLTVAEPAGEAMPRPFVLYRKPTPAAANH